MKIQVESIGDNYDLIAESIWRSGYIKSGNKIKREAEEAKLRLVAIDIAASLQHIDSNFKPDEFLKKAAVNY